ILVDLDAAERIFDRPLDKGRDGAALLPRRKVGRELELRIKPNGDRLGSRKLSATTSHRILRQRDCRRSHRGPLQAFVWIVLATSRGRIRECQASGPRVYWC